MGSGAIMQEIERGAEARHPGDRYFLAGLSSLLPRVPGLLAALRAA